MTEIKKTPIPQRQVCVAIDHPYIAGADDIYDDNLEKEQSAINAELYNLIKSLPVSDGEDIEPGEAYIDSTDRTVKVKEEEEEEEEET